MACSPLAAGLGAGALPAVTWLTFGHMYMDMDMDMGDAGALALAVGLGRGALPRSRTSICSTQLAIVPCQRRLHYPLAPRRRPPCVGHLQHREPAPFPPDIILDMRTHTASYVAWVASDPNRRSSGKGKILILPVCRFMPLAIHAIWISAPLRVGQAGPPGRGALAGFRQLVLCHSHTL